MTVMRSAKHLAVGLALCVSSVLAPDSARAETQATYEEIEETLGLVPSYLRAYPEAGVTGAWESLKGVLLNPDTALSAREKELVALAVAAQIPCDYCVYFHTQAAKANGVTEQEIAEALAMAASIRHWSTILNGAQVELEEFKQETDAIMDYLAGGEQTGNPTETGGTYAEIEETLGLVPSFLRVYPEAGVAGAWESLKGVGLNPDTSLSAREKELIAVAVGAQIPCDYCVYFHTEAAKAHGVTEEEIAEALAVAAAIRHWSTILNGAQVELEEFKQESDAIMEHMAAQAGGDR